ncbi:MAG: zinc ribbon domain-containing protein [Gammaproteobacteria bacterium]|nr:MAG: zinc ribbon domain-containing protein [Gammaproteobacteria bacterium]
MSCDISTLTNVLQSGDPEQAQTTLNACVEMLTDPTLWYWTVAFTIVCAGVGALIGKYKNAVARDTALGLILGPIGWIVSLLLPAQKPKPKCKACGKAVDAGDKHCRHCGAAL